MIVTWMLRMLVASGLVGLSVLMLDRVALWTGRPRRWVWMGGVAVVSLLPVLAWLVPSFPGFSRLLASAPEVIVGLPLAVGSAGGAMGVGESSPSAGLADLAGWLWFGAAVVSLTLYVVGWWRLGRARRTWRRDEVAGTAVLVSTAAGPAAVGLLEPAIVVPAWLLTEEERIQRMVVMHEAEHLAAGDHYLLAIAPLAIVMMPWNLVLWWIVARLRLAVELDCDRRVLSHGIGARGYGSLLLDVAGRRGVGVPAIALVSRRSNLETRILALTAGLPGRGRSRAVACAMSAVVVAVLACEVAPGSLFEPGAASDAIVRSDIDYWLDRADAGENTRYTIDGEPATRSAMRSLDRSRVAHIGIREQARLGGDGLVRDTTVASRTIMVTTAAFEAQQPTGPGSGMSLLGSDQSLKQAVNTLLERFSGDDLQFTIDGRVVEPDELTEYDAEALNTIEVVRKSNGATSSAEVRIRTERPGT